MQTKPLRSVGIDITENTINNLLEANEALRQFDTTSRQLDQSQKAIARTIIVLQSGQNAFGDMQTTINTLSNQIKVFQGSLSNLKLAIGDAINEPITLALQYINGFIIAITEMIRVFVPMKTTSETYRDALDSVADSAENAEDSMNNALASFDKFNVLNASDSETEGDIAITEALTAELLKQQQIYEDQLALTADINNKALQIAKTIKDWFMVTDEEGNFVEWTNQVKLLGDAIGILISYKIGTWISSMIYGLVALKSSLAATTLSFKLMTIASKALMAVGIFLLIDGLINLTTGWEDMSSATKAASIILVAVGGTLVLFSTLTKIAMASSTAFTTALKLQKIAAAGLALGGIGLLAANVIGLVSNWDKLSVFEKTIGIFGAIGAAALAAAAAVAAFQGAWTLGTAAVAITGALAAIAAAFVVFKSQTQTDVQGFAEGGITDARFIKTHENGVREWVGKQGNSTAVVNDSQMSDVMGNAVKMGVLEAFSLVNDGGDSSQPITVNVSIGGSSIFKETQKEARRLGYDFRKV